MVVGRGLIPKLRSHRAMVRPTALGILESGEHVRQRRGGSI